MSQKLIDRNSDLKSLQNEGFSIQLKQGYLVVHDVPYVCPGKQVKLGKLIIQVTINGDSIQPPHTHVANFMGEHPCYADGKLITQIQHSSGNRALFDNVIINHSFSAKPSKARRYNSYYEQVTTYVNIISGQARLINPSVTAKVFKSVESAENDVFAYSDTNSSRANITHISNVFRNEKIGIIGLGGTGSYILDQVAKTSVCEIHLFDKKPFRQHNSFRSPGAVDVSTFDKGISKAEHYKNVYSRMHLGIKSHSIYIDTSTVDFLKELTFVFISVDDNDARAFIVKTLLELNIPFIDVGMGLSIVDDMLLGVLRSTTGTQYKHDHLVNRLPRGESDDDLYDSNIQVADLNAMNALMAVIRWKRLLNFYHDEVHEHHSTYSINSSSLVNDDIRE